MNAKPWFVYIIENEKGHLYTGITTDPERRFQEHATSRKGAKFFNTSAPVSMVFKKKFPNRSLASKFEYFVKTLTRQQKLQLIKTRRVPDVKRSLHLPL
jgi:putative endonuclease